MWRGDQILPAAVHSASELAAGAGGSLQVGVGYPDQLRGAIFAQDLRSPRADESHANDADVERMLRHSTGP